LLEDLATLSLFANDIDDLAPLVDNLGIDGASVDVSDNPFDCTGQAGNISALEERGVNLTTSCP
jgi:hypothetical protein